MRDGLLTQETLRPQDLRQRGQRCDELSAIQITTAAGICAMVDLMREGKLPQRGFVRQEQCALSDFLANRFGRAYK